MCWLIFFSWFLTNSLHTSYREWNCGTWLPAHTRWTHTCDSIMSYYSMSRPMTPLHYLVMSLYCSHSIYCQLWCLIFFLSCNFPILSLQLSILNHFFNVRFFKFISSCHFLPHNSNLSFSFHMIALSFLVLVIVLILYALRFKNWSLYANHY